MTLEELRRKHEADKANRSRFHKTNCRYCGKPVTNQAMGRKAHMAACKQKMAEDAYLRGDAKI